MLSDIETKMRRYKNPIFVPRLGKFFAQDRTHKIFVHQRIVFEILYAPGPCFNKNFFFPISIDPQRKVLECVFLDRGDVCILTDMWNNLRRSMLLQEKNGNAKNYLEHGWFYELCFLEFVHTRSARDAL